MASSDTTGFHSDGWKFHQYSSSGGVLEGSSECILLQGGFTRHVKQSVIDSSAGTLVEGFNVLTLSSDPAFATLPAPAQGSKVKVLVHGNSSNLYRIVVSTSGVTINGNTSQFGVAGDSDVNGEGVGIPITFEATGTASYRVLVGRTSSLGISTALV